MKKAFIVMLYLVTFLLCNQKINAQEIKVFNGYGYVIDNGKIVITDYYGTEKILKIPNTISGYPVTTISDLAFDENNLTSVSIPNSVTTIGDWAFEGNNLTSVSIPNSVTKIGNGAFNKNKIIQINGEPSRGLIYGRKIDGTDDKSTIVSYGGSCDTIDFIPNSVTVIGNYAFEDCGLTSITIPNSITSIEHNAFEKNNLTSISIPNSVTKIGGGAFRWNDLTRIKLPTPKKNESQFLYWQDSIDKQYPGDFEITNFFESYKAVFKSQ